LPRDGPTGFSATCNSGGAGKWTNAYSETLRGADCIIIADKDDPGRVHAKQVAESLQGFAKRVRTIELPDLSGRKVKDASDFFAAGGEPWHIAEQAESIKTLGERLQARRFNILVKPRPAIPRYSVLGTPICTPGNLTAASAIPKGGKSAWIGAMMAATMDSGGADCLGVTSSNAEGKALLHLDTEQSEEDHYNGIERTLRRAGLAEPPPWVHSHYVTGFPIADARAAVPLLMAETERKHGGIHSVLIDGVADLAFDVNDPGEAASLVTEWHGLAIKYHCPIIGVIHLNPGTEKTRGHLGSQLERKAETNLRLEKDGDAVVVWADKNRRAPISKAHGPRFVWSNELQMHVSTASAADAKDEADREALVALADEVFADHPAMKRIEIEKTLTKRLRVSPSTAERRVARMIELTVISKSVAGLYVLNTPAE
jgi:AAA domain-containing protein